VVQAPPATKLPLRWLVAPATVLVVALAAWVVLVVQMGGMDAGPGTQLGGLGWFVGFWVTMMAAMMLPSAMPTVLSFSALSTERGGRGRAFVATWPFAAGYLATWAVVGLVAYAVDRLILSVDHGFLGWLLRGRTWSGRPSSPPGFTS
jgi:hypothetical protein